MKHKKYQPLFKELPLLLSFFVLLVPFFVFAQGSTLVNPLQFNTIQDFLKGVLGAVMYIGLPIIALIIVYSGFLFITSQGNTEKIRAAKYNFMWVVIGTGVFLGAWALTGIIAGTINLLRDNI
jgi:hypothetical protein